MDEKDCKKEKKVKNWGTGGGLYRGVKANVKTLNYVIGVLLIALVAVVIYLASTSSYQASFEVNGGEAIKSQQYKYGDHITSRTPMKTGYVFEGWYADQDLSIPWNMSEDTIEGSMTLYAKWTPAKIRVLFDLNGGNINAGTSHAPKEIAFHEPYGDLPSPVKEGYSFVGWQYNGEFIKSDTLVSMNGEHTLTAIYK